MVHWCGGKRIILGVSLIALAAAAALARPQCALAQEPTATPGAQAQTVVVEHEPFPWWDVVTGGLAAAGTLALATAAMYAAFVSLRQHLEQRRRETDLDLAKLQGDLVLLRRQAWERARKSPDEEMRLEEMEKAEDVYEGILCGMVLARPELMKAAREALTEYLEMATSEMESLRRRGG